MLKRIGSSLSSYGKKNPARIYTFASIIAVYLAKKLPGLPMEAVILFIAALFGLGEGVQRVENKKTDAALHTCCCNKEGECPVCKN